jgi:endogenous inhibitor of DNA gyrase (YacG/DUF329 family)
MRCPICDREFNRDQSTAAPFCGERCRSIDLSRWLGEVYSLPVERSDDVSEESSSTPSRGEISGSND